MSKVATSLDNGVLTITLNRPEQGNALDMAMARDLPAAGPTAALGAARRLLAEAQMASLAAQLDSEVASISARAGSAEGREGVTAFLAKRKPDFRGVS